MTRKLSILVALILALASWLYAADAGETYFRFTIQSPQELETLTKLVSIDNVEGNVVYAYANDQQLSNFRALGYTYTVLPHPSSLIVPEMARSVDEVKAWDTYPSYGQYVSMMNQYVSSYPNLCTIQNLGWTIQGRQLLVLKISDNVSTEEDEPEVFYSSSMHGDELTAYVLMLRLIDSLLTTYGTDPRITNVVNSLEIYINPLANPDGTYHGGDSTVASAHRTNDSGVDLNRNFPDPQDGLHPDGHAWQPETQAMMTFMSAHNFTISANFHGGAEVVNYPWDTWSRLHPDDTWWQLVSRRYADTVHANAPSGYLDDLNNGITNGYAWYRITGGRQDYMTYHKHGREVTIEISSTKTPSAGTLPSYWNYNRKSLLNWLTEALYGIRGVVTSASTGLPLRAFITVVSHDADSSQIYSDGDVGDYHRMLAAGTYTLRFEAANHVAQNISGVVVTNAGTTVVNVVMQPQSPYPVVFFVSHNAPPLIKPGDNVSMNVTVRNDGGYNAVNMQGVLSTADPYVTVTGSTALYPTILAFGGTGSSLTQYSFSVSPSCPSNHPVDFMVALTADGGYNDTINFSLTIARPIENFETGNFSYFPWQMSGNQPWVVVSTAPYEGNYCAQSGAITHAQTSQMSVSLNLAAAGNVSFYYKVSTEPLWDLLKFSIDGQQKGSWSGSVGWAQASYPVTAGEHTFAWAYAKDGSMSGGSDKVWVDLIVFPPLAASSLGIITDSLPHGWVNEPYSQQLTATGGTAPYTWSDLSGGLEGTGLTISSSGLVSGTPTAPGEIGFTARVQDQASGSATRAYGFTIYLSGDADGSGAIDVSDAVYLIAYIFSSGPAPEPLFTGDADCSGTVDISDVIYLIAYIFGGGPAPCVAK